MVPVPGNVGGGGMAMFKACGPGSLDDEKVGVLLYPDGSGSAAYSISADSGTAGSGSGCIAGTSTLRLSITAKKIFF